MLTNALFAEPTGDTPPSGRMKLLAKQSAGFRLEILVDSGGQALSFALVATAIAAARARSRYARRATVINGKIFAAGMGRQMK
jgi:hypothetical protein